MKAIDLCCGYGGWTQGFQDAGYEVVGYDIKKYPGYMGELIIQDINTLDASKLKGIDVIVASPPCIEFSIVSMLSYKAGTRAAPNPEQGLILVKRCKQIIDEVKPKFWAIENVRGAVKHFKPLLGNPKMKNPPWFIWGNFPSFLMEVSNHFRKEQRFVSSKGKKQFRMRKGDSRTCKIPYPISRGIAEACKVELASNASKLPRDRIPRHERD
jgi:site-specific DNA-cytosine methylase